MMYQSPKVSLLYPLGEGVLNEEPTHASEETEEKDNLIGVESLLDGLIG